VLGPLTFYGKTVVPNIGESEGNFRQKQVIKSGEFLLKDDFSPAPFPKKGQKICLKFLPV
jgi:hypothetical protein